MHIPLDQSLSLLNTELMKLGQNTQVGKVNSGMTSFKAGLSRKQSEPTNGRRVGERERKKKNLKRLLNSHPL